MNIFGVIKKETFEYMDKTAVIDGERRISYSQLLLQVERAALELKKSGVKPGHRLALLADDSADYIVVSLAALSVNAVIVPLAFFLSVNEIENIFSDLDVNWIIYSKAMPGRQGVRIFLDICEKEFYCQERLSKNSLPSGYQDLNPAFIRFSSGTTGASKGVLLSHKSIIERTDAADEGLKITSNDTVVWVLSMSFHFVVTILLFLRRGAAIVICSNDFPSSMLIAIKDLKPTFIYGSPFHYYLMANSPAFSRDCLSGVRMAVTTAMRLPLETAEKFRLKFGFELIQCYGIIEAGLPFINDSSDPAKRGSVGRILSSYQLKIQEPSDSGGKLLIKGKGMFEAYFLPWRKKDEICPDGWFDTGDLVLADQEGYVYIKGRVKEVINFCGMKVFPQEVEEVINSFDGVEESLVFGQPHTQYGELPYAKIKLKSEAVNDFKTVSLRKFCYSKLSSYKVPKDFQIVESLPKTGSGKLKRG